MSVEQKNDLEKQRAYATLGHAYLTWYLETQNDPEKTLNNAFKYFMKSLMIAQRYIIYIFCLISPFHLLL